MGRLSATECTYLPTYLLATDGVEVLFARFLDKSMAFPKTVGGGQRNKHGVSKSMGERNKEVQLKQVPKEIG